MMDRQPSGRHMFPSVPAEGRPPLSVANWAIIGIFIILAFQMLATARAFLMPVCLGILLFFVFVPFRRWMTRRGVPPGATAGIVVLGIVAGIAILGWFASGPAGQLIQDAPQISRKLKAKYEDFRQNFRGIERAAKGIEELAGSGGGAATVTTVATDPAGQSVATSTAITPPAGTPPSVAGPSGPDITRPEDRLGAPVSLPATVPAPTVEATAAAPGQLKVEVTAPQQGSQVTEMLVSMGPAIVSQLFFTLIFLFFLLASGDLLYLRIVQSFGALKEKRTAYEALREIENSLGNYLGAITIINVGLGVASGLAMWALGMPSPLLWGIAAALLNYVPYIGAAIGYVGAFVVGLVVFDDVWWALMVGGVYFGLTAIEGQFITPYFVSRRLQLNTVVVFLTVALWAWLWSVLGMVVAVPMLVVIRVLADHIPGLEKFGNFLAGEDPPAIAEDEDGDQDKAPQPAS
ncbi:AI-2E family transporter [Paracoccus contaminans]|uniref:AI-2E family transporter n=1 Tax=Paracoccus contaminans TaxID=1945662 RepID=A0A1W6CWV2_9RHOB|nr:AI-2E family transporter [Paracoccus contaminans]ARJ69358.1 hypothetical protein B0A89_06670 [Paracoccus contaminans]